MYYYLKNVWKCDETLCIIRLWKKRNYKKQKKDVTDMKIGEAKIVYREQIKAYNEQKSILAQKKEKLEKQMKTSPDAKDLFAKEAATLELTLEALDKKQSEYQSYMDLLNQQWTAEIDLLSAKQQGEAMEKYTKDTMKVMEVARRLMKGAIVPATDEKKLMEYSMELYQAAKNIGALAQQKKREEYDSLWKDEEETEYEDPIEAANEKEAFSSGPAIVEAADTMAGAEMPEG